MELTRQEENKNRIISGSITAMIFLLLLWFLIWFQIITPNPPFPESDPGGGGGRLMALGMVDAGSGDIDFGSMGKVTEVTSEPAPADEKLVTDPNGEVIPIPEKQDVKDPKPVVKNDKVVIKPVKQKEKSAAEKLRETYNKHKGKDGGGHGDAENPGDDGRPDGDKNGDGKGGKGGGNDTCDGKGDGPGKGPGKGPGYGGGISFSLGGRAFVTPPELPKDTKEEGKVVVEIVVNAAGEVIEANPNGRGTTTSSVVLKMKAKQAALKTKFNVSGKFEEQSGTITIVFSFD